jgi:hypothetical protein
MFLWDTLV